MSGSKKHRIRKWLLDRYGKNPLDFPNIDDVRENVENISIYYKELQETEKTSGACVDDITWNDLEMDEVFFRINQTKSYVGEQMLYDSLHELEQNNDLDSFEKQIEFFDNNQDDRLDLEQALLAIGKRDDDYSVPMFLNNMEYLSIKYGFAFHILQALLVLFLVLAICTFKTLWGILALVVAVINVLVYTFTKDSCETFLYSLGSIKQLVISANAILSNSKWKDILYDKDVDESINKLRKIVKWVGNFQMRKNQAAVGNEFAFLFEYLLGIFLYDLSTYNHILKMLQGKQENVWKIYEFIGNLDMMLSVASFRKSKDTVCVPVIYLENDKQNDKYIEHEENALKDRISYRTTYKNTGISMEAVCHPLIENCVSNNFILSKNAILTGANASGKSTFMKAVAINTILAQTIHTCVAKSFSMPKVLVMTSMALRDDIVKGESYYVTEVKYLKRMIDSLDTGKKYLFVVDEIFKGTNTVERIAASETVLKYFYERNCHVMVATHDMQLAERMSDMYDSYHFNSQMQDNDILFDYVICEGYGGNTNAIDLLACFGFPEEIVQDARKVIGEKICQK